MADTLVPVTIRPGVYRNGTKYQARGRWYDVNLVRWFEGQMRPVGGWDAVRETDNDPIAVAGVPRQMIAWRGLTNTAYLAVSTESNLYAYSEGVLTDITPTGLVVGDPDTVYGNGAYGDGDYGAGPYGQANPLLSEMVEPGAWQLDTFGENLVGVLSSDGRIYLWDLITAEAELASVDAPEGCIGLVVTPERFLVTLGADGYPRQLRWASQESLTVWTPAVENTAGDLDLQGTGKLMCGARGRNETLIWTENELYALRYLGGTLVYGVERLGTNCGIISRKAYATIDGNAVWMGRNSFFSYDGFVKPIPSDVSDYVFGDFNINQKEKVFAVPVSQFGEVWWFYPSASSTECDRYVVFNYREGYWSLGQLSRTCGVDRGAYDYPIMAAPTGAVYEHEKGFDHDGVVPYAETGPMQLGEGERTSMMRRIVPDEKTLGDVEFHIYSAFYPTDTEVVHGPYTPGAPTSVRVSGRQLRLRVDEVRAGDWRVGNLRVNVVPAGGR
jgi:hypothetical protein